MLEIPEDVTTIPAEQRTLFIIDLRNRVNAGEEIPTEQIRRAVALIHLDRGSHPRRKDAKKDASKSEREARPKVTLADF